MKTDDVSFSSRSQANQFPYGKPIELSFLTLALFTKKRRVHRPPPHYEVNDPAGRIVVKEFRTHRKVQRDRAFRTPEHHARNSVHVKKGSVICHENHRP